MEDIEHNIPEYVEPERIVPTQGMMDTTRWALAGQIQTGLGEGHPSKLDVFYFEYLGKDYTLVSPYHKEEDIDVYAYLGIRTPEMCLAWFLDEY